MDQRRLLKERYKQMKPEMGLYVIQSKVSGKMLLAAATDLKSAINGSRFKLKGGMHPNRALQAEWNAAGEDAFEFRILDRLEYSKDPAKTDYTDDLEELRIMWMEKLSGEGAVFYGA